MAGSRNRPGQMAKTTVRVDVRPSAPHPIARRAVLTLLAGPDRPGRMIPLGDAEVTIGRTEDATVVFDDDSLSRRHARFFQQAGRHFVADLGSTNGTFVNGVPIREPAPLEDGARIQLGVATVLRFTFEDETQIEASRRLYEQTVRDALTGAFNRHFLDERLRAELSYAKRQGVPLSVLFVDADHFKRINDTYGHSGGDEVLRRIARLLAETMRTEDVVARFGGEEFVIVVRGVDAVGVLAVAERVRAEVEALSIVHEGRRIPVTVSIGVATQSPDREFASVEELLAVADGALYRAKEAGRNRVFLA
jgi:diguanylate cyclase (GGDEF)-like protein